MRHWWTPPTFWKGATVYVIGGGSSLRDMDWSRLHGKQVIGCNDAYMLGEKVVDVCCFGDMGWFKTHINRQVRVSERAAKWTGLKPGQLMGPGLSQFKGLKVTCCRNVALMNPPPRGILIMDWRPIGLVLTPGRLGWNLSTGACSINLAVIFGATRIVLLGFDMHLGEDGASNYHPNLKDPPNAAIYDKFRAGFEALDRGIKKHGGIEVLNATPGSAMDIFPIVERDEVL